MAGGKAAPIKGPAFDSNTTLSKADCGMLAVHEQKQCDHLTPNWLRKARCLISLHLRPDNVTIDHASAHLAGKLHSSPKTYQCKNFWSPEGEATLALVIDPLDLTSFSFPPNCLSSNLLDSASIPHKFMDNDIQAPQEVLSAAGISGFCLRATLYPSHPDWIKLALSLFPLPADALREEHQFAISPAFPGFQLDHGVSIHLGPSAAEIFPGRLTGSPIAPILVVVTPWARAIGHPPTVKMNNAIASFLRTAVRPVHVKSADTLSKAWAELKEKGENALKFKTPEHIWPEPQASSANSEGMTSSLFFFPLFSAR